MISGIFALSKEYNRKEYFARVKKFILVLVIWSIIYYLTRNGFNFSNMGKVLVNSFFNADMTSRHLWYMYPLIGIYIALPFIQNMCKNLSFEQENLFLVLWICLSGLSFIFVPIAKAVLKTDVEVSYPIPLINSAYYLGYFVGGYILYKRFYNARFDKKRNLACAAIYILSIFITILLTYVISVKNNSFFEAATWYRGALIIIATFSIFILVIANENKFKSKAICRFSKHTFGIYLIHIMFLDILKQNINIVELNPLGFIPIITLILYFISLAVCTVLSKLPFVNKVIF
jgi:surface polysaccharide O-acyltransferase-like enzyme